MKEDNEAVIKALNMYGRLPETWELLEEIERLNNIIKDVREYCNNDSNFEIMTDFDTFENHNIIGKDILEILDKGSDEISK